MFSINPITQLSPKEFIEKIKRLKVEYDKLTDYGAKLEFCYNNGLDISIGSYGISEESDTKNLPENNIRIYPDTNEEKIIFKKFYYTLFQRHNFNTLETSKAGYWKQIEQGANPIAYTKNVIAEIEKEYVMYSKFKDTGYNSLRSYCNGYDASENGQIETFLNSPSFHNNLLPFFTGEVHEKYKRFLVKQLNKLESGNPPMFNVHEKLEISCRLIGENKVNTTQLVFHHIPYIINYFSITPLEARDILLALSGANTPKANVIVMEKIIAHLERKHPEILSEKPQPSNKYEVKQPNNSALLVNEPFYDKSIFTGLKGFQIFEAFKTEIITAATEYADYSFLFIELKKDGLIHDIKHKKFISYLSEKHNSLLESKGYKQFKFSSTKLKARTYSRFKKQFQ